MPNLLTYLLSFLVIAIAAGMVLLLSRYRRDITAARQRINSLGSQVIETDCGRVEYLRVGEGSPVLVVHGALGGVDQGLWLARSYDVAQHYQVIIPSRFGYLRSPVPPNANLSMQADAFVSLLDALKIRQVAVLGVSAGSTSAIRFAARYPERTSALILYGPDAPGEIQMPLPPRFVFDTLFRSDFLYWAMITFFGKQVQRAIGLVPEGVVLTPEYAAIAKRVQSGDLPTSRRMDGWIFETYTCANELKESVTPDSPYPLSKIQTPVLVINAADDPITIPENVRRLAEQLPNVRHFVVPDGGHLNFGHMEEVKAEIAQFLRMHAGEARNAQTQETQVQL